MPPSRRGRRATSTQSQSRHSNAQNGLGSREHSQADRIRDSQGSLDEQSYESDYSTAQLPPHYAVSAACDGLLDDEEMAVDGRDGAEFASDAMMEYRAGRPVPLPRRRGLWATCNDDREREQDKEHEMERNLEEGAYDREWRTATFMNPCSCTLPVWPHAYVWLLPPPRHASYPRHWADSDQIPRVGNRLAEWAESIKAEPDLDKALDDLLEFEHYVLPETWRELGKRDKGKGRAADLPPRRLPPHAQAQVLAQAPAEVITPPPSAAQPSTIHTPAVPRPPAAPPSAELRTATPSSAAAPSSAPPSSGVPSAAPSSGAPTLPPSSFQAPTSSVPDTPQPQPQPVSAFKLLLDAALQTAPESAAANAPQNGHENGHEHAHENTNVSAHESAPRDAAADAPHDAQQNTAAVSTRPLPSAEQRRAWWRNEFNNSPGYNRVFSCVERISYTQKSVPLRRRRRADTDEFRLARNVSELDSPLHPDLQTYLQNATGMVFWVIPVHGPLITPGWKDPIADPGENYAASPARFSDDDDDPNRIIRLLHEASAARAVRKPSWLVWTPALVRAFIKHYWEPMWADDGLTFGPISLHVKPRRPDPFGAPTRQPPLRAHEHVPPGVDAVGASTPPVRHEVGDHIRIYCQPRRAMAVRLWLHWWTVDAATLRQSLGWEQGAGIGPAPGTRRPGVEATIPPIDDNLSLRPFDGARFTLVAHPRGETLMIA